MNTEEGNPIVGYLVYDDFDTALARADSEGSACNFPYFQGTKCCCSKCNIRNTR